MICRICGETKDGKLFLDWVKDTFTNHDLLKPGDVICKSCEWMFSESSIKLAEKVGKEKPQRMRNYSHFFLKNGDWMPLAKDKKSQMSDILLGDDCIKAAISESGQKHVLFRAKEGWWQFEEFAILPNKAGLLNLLENIETLLDEFSKKEIETGEYSQNRILKFGFDAWNEIEQQIKSQRGNLLFKLSLFLGQKDGQYRKNISRESNITALEEPERGLQAEIQF